MCNPSILFEPDVKHDIWSEDNSNFRLISAVIFSLLESSLYYTRAEIVSYFYYIIIEVTSSNCSLHCSN
jgi:hypothetical protein